MKTLDIGSKNHLIEIIQLTQKGNFDLLLACREIAGYSLQLKGVRFNQMSIFEGVASECDGVPLGSERTFWDSATLKQKDIETDKYRSEVRETVLTALSDLKIHLKQFQTISLF